MIEIKHKAGGEVLHRVAADTLAGAALRGAHLSGADLTGVDLTGADLRGADLSDAVLTLANLRGANLQGAAFGRAETTLRSLRNRPSPPAPSPQDILRMLHRQARSYRLGCGHHSGSGNASGSRPSLAHEAPRGGPTQRLWPFPLPHRSSISARLQIFFFDELTRLLL
jgi:pentapeptide repeat protein